MKTSTHKTLAGARAELDALKVEGGWTFLPSDEPERGSFGAVAYRQDRRDPKAEEVLRVEWLPFGELRTEVFVARTAEDFADALGELRRSGLSMEPGARAPMVLPADDPVQRMIGFVAYSDGVAKTVRAPLTAVKEAQVANPELGAELLVLAHLRNNMLLR